MPERDVAGEEGRKPLLLGEMPSPAGDPFWAFPLSGSPAVRILKWLGVEYEGAAFWALVERFDTMNAQERHGPWSKVRARSRWTEYLATVPDGHPVTVVCLGAKAAAAIGRHPVEWGEWREGGLLRHVAIPHPSGRNRLYNDPEMVETARRVLREALWLCDPEREAWVTEDGRVDFVKVEVRSGPIR